jgi:hypothetical protein
MPNKTETPKNKMKAGLNTVKKEQNEKLKTQQERKGPQQAVIGKVRKMKSNLKSSMVNRSKRAEKWHKDTAGWPLKRLAKVNRFEQVAGDMIAIQTKTIGHGYDLARTVVTKMDDIADDILTLAEKHRAA